MFVEYIFGHTDMCYTIDIQKHMYIYTFAEFAYTTGRLKLSTVKHFSFLSMTKFEYLTFVTFNPVSMINCDA